MILLYINFQNFILLVIIKYILEFFIFHDIQPFKNDDMDINDDVTFEL